MDIGSIILACAIAFALWFEFAGRKLGIAAIPITPWQRRNVVSTAAKHLPAPNARIAELGCGWGGMIAALRRTCPNSHIAGYELFFPAWLVSALRFCVSPRIKILRQDIFTSDLTQYDVIVCYLSHDLMKRLQGQKFKPGTVIVSNAFPFPDWKPTETIVTDKGIKFQVFVYHSP